MIGIRVKWWKGDVRWHVECAVSALWIDAGHFTIDMGRLPV